MITATDQIVYLVTCNRSGCGRPDWIPAVSLEDAAALALVDGWKVEGDGHVCPPCQATDGVPHGVQARDAAYEAYGLGGPA